MKRVQRIERVRDGIRVELADGSVAVYASSALLPDDVAGLLMRMDSAPGAAQAAAGWDDSRDAAEAARSAYRARLEGAYEQGRLRHDPDQGLRGVDAYKARLESQWAAPPPAKGRVCDHKR